MSYQLSVFGYQQLNCNGFLENMCKKLNIIRQFVSSAPAYQEQQLA